MAQKSKNNPDLLAQLWQNMVLSWRLMFDGRVTTTAKLIPVLMVAYILSPIDLIPDLLLPFGVVDDIGALLLGFQLFIRSAPPDVVAEYRRRMARRGKPDEPKIVEGQYSIRKGPDEDDH